MTRKVYDYVRLKFPQIRALPLITFAASSIGYGLCLFLASTYGDRDASAIGALMIGGLVPLLVQLILDRLRDRLARHSTLA
jgi:hypothetical protein